MIASYMNFTVTDYIYSDHLRPLTPTHHYLHRPTTTRRLNDSRTQYPSQTRAHANTHVHTPLQTNAHESLHPSIYTQLYIRNNPPPSISHAQPNLFNLPINTMIIHTEIFGATPLSSPQLSPPPPRPPSLPPYKET